MSQQADIDVDMPEAPQIYVNAILGPVIGGWSLAIFMFGCLSIQYYGYITSDLYRQDKPRTKAILHVVVALATTVCSWWQLTHYSLDQHRDSVTLFAQTVVDCMDLTFVGLEGAIVQLFLAHRATALMGRSKWRYLYWLLITLGVLCGLAGSLLYLAASVMLRAGADINTFNYAIGAWLWGSTWCDLLITVTLVAMLRTRMVHFSQQTDSILASLIRLAIQSAAPTAIMSLTGAILAFAFPVTSLYANITGVFWGPLAGLYAMSLIATLNGRNAVREAANRSVFTAVNPNTMICSPEMATETQRNTHFNHAHFSSMAPGSPLPSFTPPRSSASHAALTSAGVRLEISPGSPRSPVVQIGFPASIDDARRGSDASDKSAKVALKV